MVTAADIEKTPDTPLELIIQRVVPGVVVNTVDGTMVIHLRGMTNAMGDLRPPLFILNGLRTAPSASGEMPQVDPKDVQTIKVLKGTDAAIYGLDGANGVIVITTKGH